MCSERATWAAFISRLEIKFLTWLGAIYWRTGRKKSTRKKVNSECASLNRMFPSMGLPSWMTWPMLLICPHTTTTSHRLLPLFLSTRPRWWSWPRGIGNVIPGWSLQFQLVTLTLWGQLQRTVVNGEESGNHWGEMDRSFSRVRYIVPVVEEVSQTREFSSSAWLLLRWGSWILSSSSRQSHFIHDPLSIVIEGRVNHPAVDGWGVYYWN